MAEDSWKWTNPNDVYFLIWYSVILPIFIGVGLIANVIAFCVWLFGPKSKSMCCAVYFAANATVDFLWMTRPLLFDNTWHLSIQPTDFKCKLLRSVYVGCLQLSTCISAIITVERSLTIIFPLVFKTQDMRKRSKILLTVLVVLQPFCQFLVLYYAHAIKEEDAKNLSFIYDMYWCVIDDMFVAKLHKLISFVIMFISFVIILVFNLVTVATLTRQRLKSHMVTGGRNHVNVFTKLTLLTGVSFVFSYALMVVMAMNFFTPFEIPIYMQLKLYAAYNVMLSFNGVMNPIIGFIVCKSVRQDIKHFQKVIARVMHRTCTRRICQQNIMTSNENTSARAT